MARSLKLFVKLKATLLSSAMMTAAVLSLSASAAAFCPVSFIPGDFSCEEQGVLKWAGPGFPNDQVAPNSQTTVNISGGCPPYAWSLDGEGYWLKNDITFGLTNVVYTDSDTNCLAAITVVDKYGHQVSGHLRRPGRWVTIGNYCQLAGPATKHLGYHRWHGWRYERIQGQYRQYQSYRADSFLGTCLWTEPPCGNQRYTCELKSNPGEECITLESTGLIANLDSLDYPCAWQSPEMSLDEFGSYHTYCTNRGALGWTSMKCFYSKKLKVQEWQCD